MTTLIPKFNYASLERATIDGKRLYTTPDGSNVASVTTILDHTKSEETKLALAKWRAAVGDNRANQITTEAASRGTRMHSYLEQFVLTGSVPKCGTNPHAKISHAMASTIINTGLVNITEFWGSEVSLYYPGLYAGTADLVAVWKGQPAIIDFKQSNKIKTWEDIEDYKCQLVAYGLAHNRIYGTHINTGVVLMAVKPELDKQLNILQPPQYLEFVLQGDEWVLYESKWLDRVQQFYQV